MAAKHYLREKTTALFALIHYRHSMDVLFIYKEKRLCDIIHTENEWRKKSQKKKKKEEKNPCESSAKMNDKSKVNDFTMYSYEMVRYSSQHHIHDYIMYILPNHKWIATTIDIKRACSRIYTHTHEKKKWKRFRNWQIHSLTVRLHYNTSHTHNFYTVWRTTTMDRTIHMHPFLCRLLEQANNECFHSSTTNTHA